MNNNYHFACNQQIWLADLNFGKRMHNIAIQHYKKIWGNDLKIEDMNGNELDKKFSIDFIITDQLKQKIHLQEKFQRQEYSMFDTITIEYYSNIDHKILGAFFKMNIDYYIMGYATQNESDFEKLIILKWTAFKEWIRNNFTEEQIKKQLRENKEHGRASLLWIPINQIPEDIILYNYNINKELKEWM